MDIIQNCEVIGFEIVGNKLRKVLTSQGAVVTQKAVMSVAGYSSSLARLAALELPITTMALQAMVTEPVKPVLDVVVMSAAVHAYVSQSDRGEIVIGAGADTYNSYAQRVVCRHNRPPSAPLPFPIQRIQTGRGGEFFAESVQRWLAEHFIKFRPTPPRSPHLNGKVERSQLTDLQEFWACQDLRNLEIAQRIEEWQFDYNWRRPHGSLGGKTPAERIAECSDVTPLSEDIAALYDPSRERIRHRDYRMDQKLAAFHASGSLRSAL